MRSVTTEDIPTSSLVPPQPTPSGVNITSSVTSVCSVKAETAWWSRPKEAKTSLPHARCCLPGPASGRGNDGSLPVSQWLSRGSTISSFHPVPVGPARITPDHRHLWQRASCFPPGQLFSPWKRVTFSFGSTEVSRAEIFSVSGEWILLILSFWYCFGVCYLYRIRLILVRHG